MPAPGDTIIAQASAPGRSERAVLRVSGPQTGLLLGRLQPAPPPPARRGAWPCDIEIQDGDPRGLCPAVILLAPAPASYTGEDTAEIFLPANPHLVGRILERCCAIDGVRPAGPGEFTARAYLNGRLTLDEAEGVAAVIAAHTADDLDAAQRLAMGQSGRLYQEWSEELSSLLALVEAGIDFTDQEDVVPIAPRDLRARIASLRETMSRHTRGQAADASAGLAPLVALVGPPNAGKSTLFNTLLARARSVVADEAGTTRDAIVEELHLDDAAGPGLAVRLVDLPGLDALPAGPAAQAAQARARECLALADALLYCDPRGDFAPLAAPPGVPILRVRTKADLPKPAMGAGLEDLAVCALDGWKLAVLRRAIADLALGARGSCSVALARHARAIFRAAAVLQEAESEIATQARSLDQPELLAESLREAIALLGEVIGRVTPDDVLGRIFASFCVGK